MPAGGTAFTSATTSRCFAPQAAAVIKIRTPARPAHNTTSAFGEDRRLFAVVAAVGRACTSTLNRVLISLALSVTRFDAVVADQRDVRSLERGNDASRITDHAGGAENGDLHALEPPLLFLLQESFRRTRPSRRRS